jgi:hypothetical protein
MAKRKPRFKVQPYKGHGPNDWSPHVHGTANRFGRGGAALARSAGFISRMRGRL